MVFGFEAKVLHGLADAVDEPLVLVRLEAARGIDDRAAGPDALEGGEQQPRLQADEVFELAGFEPPAHLGPSAEHAGVAARHIDERGIKRAGGRILGFRKQLRSMIVSLSRFARDITVSRRFASMSQATIWPRLSISSARCVVLPPGAEQRSRMRWPGCGASALAASIEV